MLLLVATEKLKRFIFAFFERKKRGEIKPKKKPTAFAFLFQIKYSLAHLASFHNARLVRCVCVHVCVGFFFP